MSRGAAGLKLRTDSRPDGQVVPSRCAAGRLDASAGATFGADLDPHFAWSGGPAGTESLALTCHDGAAPSHVVAAPSRDDGVTGRLIGGRAP